MKAAYRMRVGCESGTQAGLTLVELMIAITLGLLVIMAATALLLSAKSGYVAQDGDAQVQDAGRYALEIVGRAIRQASYENWDTADAPVLADAGSVASIDGLDARRVSADSDDIAKPLTDSINGSDVLAVRFFGAGSGDHGDGTMLNCAGFGIAAATSPSARGWSIFYVANGKSGVPGLYCKYQGKEDETGQVNWTAQAIAHGVESFQVLYGVDTDGDGIPNQMMNATAIKALDETLVLEGETADELAKDKNRKTHWKKVVTIKLALLVRGAENARADALTTQYDLFGKEYADATPIDVGVRIKEENLSQSVRGRIRKVFASTIQLRNQSVGGA
jgi:type IV pilus assembly protein PilW